MGGLYFYSSHEGSRTTVMLLVSWAPAQVLEGQAGQINERTGTSLQQVKFKSQGQKFQEHLRISLTQASGGLGFLVVGAGRTQPWQGTHSREDSLGGGRVSDK